MGRAAESDIAPEACSYQGRRERDGEAKLAAAPHVSTAASSLTALAALGMALALVAATYVNPLPGAVREARAGGGGARITVGR